MKTQQKPFDFSETYFNKRSKDQIKALRRHKTGQATRKELSVNANGLTTVFIIDQDGEYYDKRGMPLTAQLELLAKIGNSKVSIHERKGV